MRNSRGENNDIKNGTPYLKVGIKKMIKTKHKVAQKDVDASEDN